MNAAELIDAKQRGVPFERILKAVESGRESVSALPIDQVEFFESMLSEVKKAVVEFEQAIHSDDLPTIKKTSESLNEIFTMVKDCCESSGTADR